MEKDKVVGKLDLYYDGELLASVTLVTANSVERSQLRSLFGHVKAFLTSPTVKTVIRIILIIVICYLVLLLAVVVYKAVRKANSAAQKRARSKRRAESDKQRSAAREKPKDRHGAPENGENK